MEAPVPPILTGRFGLEQRCSYRHWDLYDEEVPEVDLDTAVSRLDLAAGCAVRTFLLLGDQNAGKSTMLHSFCRDGDPRFMQLSSLLPVLSSSFLNTRLVPRIDGDIDVNQHISSVRDEMPFMDTDIARGLVLLTLENFLFFCNEFGIPGYGVGPDAIDGAVNLPADFTNDTRFVALQFVELGGDHLDRLIQFHASHGKVDAVRSSEMSVTSSNDVSCRNDDRFWSDIHEVLSGSMRLLADTSCTVYFINCATLFPEGKMRPSSLRPLLRKLLFLDQVLANSGNETGASCEVLFFCSRTSQVSIIDFSATLAWSVARDEIISFLQEEASNIAAPSQDLLPQDLPPSATQSHFVDEGLDLSALDEVAGKDSSDWRSAEERAGPLLAFLQDMLTKLVMPALRLRLQYCGVFAVRNLLDDSILGNDYGSLCAPSVVRNVARLLQRRVSSAPKAGELDKVATHVAELILRCAAGLRQVNTCSMESGVATLTGRWMTHSDLAGFLEEQEADNAAVPLPELTSLRSWPLATSMLLDAGILAEVANSDGALPAIAIDIVAEGSEGASRIPGIRLRSRRRVVDAAINDGASNVLFVSRKSNACKEAVDTEGDMARVVGLPLDAEFFELLSTEASIHAISSYLEVVASKKVQQHEDHARHFQFFSPEARQSLTNIYIRLRKEIHEGVAQVVACASKESLEKESFPTLLLERLIDLASDAWQARALLRMSASESSPLPATDPAEPAPKRACATAALDAATALNRLAEKLLKFHVSTIAIESLTSVLEEGASERCLRISLSSSLISTLNTVAT